MFWILIFIKSKIVTATDKEPEETSYINVFFFVLKENRYGKVGSLMVCINIWYFWFLKWSRMTNMLSCFTSNQVLSNNIPTGIKCRGFFMCLCDVYPIFLSIFLFLKSLELYYICKALHVFKTAYNSQFWKQVSFSPLTLHSTVVRKFPSPNWSRKEKWIACYSKGS